MSLFIILNFSKKYPITNNPAITYNGLIFSYGNETIKLLKSNINAPIVFNKLNVIGNMMAIRLVKFSRIITCTSPRRIKMLAVFEE